MGEFDNRGGMTERFSSGNGFRSGARMGMGSTPLLKRYYRKDFPNLKRVFLSLIF